MTSYAAFLRAVNVGGVKVAMADLRRIAEDLGHSEVATYINSGNLMLRSDQPAATVATGLSDALEQEYGRPVEVAVRTKAELAAILASNPFPDGNPSQVTIALLLGAAEPGAEQRLAEFATANEPFVIADDVVYVEFGDGIGESKLALKLPKALGVVCTVRNLRTVQTVHDKLP